MDGLADKVIFVTGGGSGIGRATAVLFAAYGSKVMVGDIDRESAESTRDIVAANGGEASFFEVDVMNDDLVASAVKATVDQFGRLDFAFNNAGIDGSVGAVARQSPADWQRVIAVNLGGVFSCMRHEIPEMLKNGGGVIVNTASVAGLQGFAGMSPYAASKHGVIGLTRSAAMEYATRNIRINSVCPGTIDTPMNDHMAELLANNARASANDPTTMSPMKRNGTPREIAGAVAWLCSDLATYATGSELIVDGGLHTGHGFR